MNIDDAHGGGSRTARGSRSSRSRPRATPAADWRAIDVRGGADGSTFRIVGPGGVEADASVALPGPFNVANALGAVVALVEAGCAAGHGGGGGGRVPGVPGRLERVDAGQDFTVWSTTRTSRERWRRCCARCARSPAAG